MESTALHGEGSDDVMDSRHYSSSYKHNFHWIAKNVYFTLNICLQSMPFVFGYEMMTLTQGQVENKNAGITLISASVNEK